MSWIDQLAGSPIGEPAALTHDGVADDLVIAFVSEITGGPASLSEYNREWILNLVETQEHLKQIFGCLPGSETVLPRIYRFMHARHRTPEKTLEHDEAIELVHRHVQALVDHRDMILEEPARFADAGALTNFIERLRHLDVLWTDEATTYETALHFDGKVIDTNSGARSAWSGSVFSSEELSQFGLVNAAGSLLAEITSDLAGWHDSDEDSLPSHIWVNAEVWLGRLVDFRYGALIDYLLGPVFVDRFDGEPFYRLWEGGASMWIGADAIEVRTDWARRWPNSRYVG